MLEWSTNLATRWTATGSRSFDYGNLSPLFRRSPYCGRLICVTQETKILVDLKARPSRGCRTPTRCRQATRTWVGRTYHRKIHLHRPPRSITPFPSPGVGRPEPSVPQRIVHKSTLQPGHPLRGEARQGSHRLPIGWNAGTLKWSRCAVGKRLVDPAGESPTPVKVVPAG